MATAPAVRGAIMAANRRSPREGLVVTFAELVGLLEQHGFRLLNPTITVHNQGGLADASGF